jgi:hypothetical protein
MSVEERRMLMRKPDGHQRKQKMSNDYEISRDVVEQAQVISENVLAAETHLREKFPHAETRTQGTDLNAHPAGNAKCARPARNADEAADAADRAELSCDPKERGKAKIKASLQVKGR